MKKQFRIIVFFIVTTFLFFCLLGATIYSKNKIKLIINSEEINVLEKEYKIKLSTEIKVLIYYKNDFYKYYQANKDKDTLNDFSCINDEIKPDLEKAIKSIEYPYINDQMLWDNVKAEFSYVEGKKGKKVECDNIIGNFYKNFGANTILDLPTKETEKEITVEILKKRTREIGQFSTSFDTSSKNRKHNVRLATSKLNGIRLQPQEELSFNKLVGERTKENGFLTSKIISNGDFVDGVGGGVCQVSTTLYNAWIRSDLGVIHARNHSLPVSYVPTSFDAMVSSSNDLTLFNSSPYEVFIKAYTKDCKIFISVFGNEKEEKLVLRNKIIAEVPCNEYEEVDWAIDWKENESFRIIKQPKNGIISELYKDTYMNNKLIKSEKLRRCIYGVQKGKIVRKKENINNRVIK